MTVEATIQSILTAGTWTQRIQEEGLTGEAFAALGSLAEGTRRPLLAPLGLPGPVWGPGAGRNGPLAMVPVVGFRKVVGFDQGGSE